MSPFCSTADIVNFRENVPKRHGMLMAKLLYMVQWKNLSVKTQPSSLDLRKVFYMAVVERTLMFECLVAEGRL